MSSQLFLLSVVSAMVPSHIAADKLQDRPNLTCLTSWDPAAVNATLLYGDHKDEGALWSRDPTSAPLPRCSSSPSPSHCEVCLLGDVYILCDNLPAGAVLHLERSGSAIRIKESGCPMLPPAGQSHSDEDKLPLDDSEPTVSGCIGSSPESPLAHLFCLLLSFCALLCTDENRTHYGAVASPILCFLILTGLLLWRLHQSCIRRT